MRRIPTQAVLPFGTREAVLNRQIRERAAGKKVRPGPGRPQKNNGRVAHRQRPVLKNKTAVHVTLRVRDIVPNLRTRRRFNVIKQAFVKFCGSEQNRASTPKGFRLVHFALLSNHVHFVVEADSRRSLAMGMQKLLHSISRRLNALSVSQHGAKVSTKAGPYRALPGWLGRVFCDRYHAHLLKTPTEIERAVRYVLTNAERHGVFAHGSRSQSVDAFTSLGAAADERQSSGLVLVAVAKGFLLSRACRRVQKHLGLL